MATDTVINKVETIERCLKRIRETYNGDANYLEDLDKQDIILLNLQRACQAAIDLAAHICALKRLGVPQDSKEVFQLLDDHQLITSEIAQSMKGMVGFRNVAVHDYQAINLAILKSILEKHLSDFTDFTSYILKNLKNIGNIY